MAIKAEILNELMEISPVIARMERVNPYTVPAGYFEGLDEHLLTMAKIAEQSPALQGIAMKKPMQVPEGYFEGLAGSILNKIKAEENLSVDDELRNISPLLYSLDKVNVYDVPTGYFETLGEELLNKVSPKETAKVISFSQRKSVKWVRYAAAAVVIGLIGTITLFLLNTGGNKFESDIVKGIKWAKEEGRFEKELDKTSDDAIASYLDKTADESDALQMVASVDDSQLPTEEELMSDEKLIDELLKESENKTTN